MESRPLVLVSAFACEPGRGSEPGVGFAFARAIEQFARQHGNEAIILTRTHTARATAAALEAEYGEVTTKVVGVSLPRLLIRLTKRRRVRVAYLWWQVAAAIKARRLAAGRRCVTYHHVTFATYALPSAVRLLPRHWALVFGPAGSATVSTTAKRSAKDVSAGAMRRIVSRVNLGSVDLAITTNDRAATEVPPGRTVIVEPNVILPDDVLDRARVDQSRIAHLDLPERLNVVTVGLLIPRKRYEQVLTALARPAARTLHCWFIGDGPERDRLEGLASALDITDRVHFLGTLELQDVRAVLARAAVLAHPSEREGSPWSVAEAQAMGCVPVVYDGSGADTLVRLAGLGRVVMSDADADTWASVLADAALSPPATPSMRWAASRMPAMLAHWYGHASSNRVERTRASLDHG